MESFTTTILSNTPVSSTSWLMRLERGTFKFQAGELVTLYGKGRHACRDYSVASGEEESHIEVLYRLVEEGTLTPELVRMKAGQAIDISGPTGRFTLRDTSRPIVFIATGTGIAPFRAYFRTHSHLNFTLIHGVRDAEDLYFKEEWTDLAYRPCLSGPLPAPAGCFHGRLTAYLPAFSRPDNAHYYLCGANEMIYEVSDFLTNVGIPTQDIFHEPYYYRWDA